MRTDLLTPPTFPADEASVVVGFGPFAARVLELVQQEFATRGVPERRAVFLAFVAAAERAGTPAAAGPLPLEVRDTSGYLASPGNEALHAVVTHVPDSSWTDAAAGPATLPALGFVTLHRFDETLVTSRLRATLEAMRGRSPQDRLRCIVVGDMGDGLAAGMTVPFLLRVHDLLEHLRVHLEVVLVTSDAAATSDTAAAERNCVAQAMLWEALQAGKLEFVYPGKEGVREERAFHGPLACTPYVFSGGVGDSRYGEAATASAIATCITTLLLTRLGDDLAHCEAEARAAAGDRDSSGGSPPAIATVNVGGVELHAFPSLFRLRAVRAFLGALAHTPEVNEIARHQRAASAFRTEAGLTDEAIAAVLGLGARPFTRDELQSLHLPPEKLHEYVSARLDEDLGGLLEMARGGPPSRTAEALLDGARASIAKHGRSLLAGPAASLPAALVFYGTLEQEFDACRQSVVERAGVARLELGRTPDRERLDLLLERLRRDTALPARRRPGTTARFAATVSVSLTTQLRKILEVAAEIRAHALVLAEGAVLSEIYSRLARFCAQQREEMQGRLYVLNQLHSRCARAEEMTQRTARAALTYRRGPHEALVERLYEAVRAAVPVPATPEVIAHLGGDLLAFRADAPDALDRLLAAIPVDEQQLSAATDAALARDADLAGALRAAQAQIYPGALVDRDAPQAAASRRSRFVLCTRPMYEAHAQDVFAGYDHLETSDPYAVLMVHHETGLRFMALATLRRILPGYLALPAAERALGHLTAELAATLPALEA